jgi:IclR family transcriptional regulator, pca regulon regulatory protein
MCAVRTTEAADVRRRDRNQVAALANGMRAIEAFAASRQRMTLAEVAKHSGLTRAAARRYLHTLVANGYADFDGKRFQLTSRVLRLGHAYISSVPLPQIAQPIVEELGHRTDESIALSVLEGNESLTIASSAPRRILGIFTRIGTHLPALSTATGRVLLAGRPDDAIDDILRSARIQRLTPKTKTSSEQIWEELRRIRRAGYALNDEEIEVGLRVIAVPVRDNGGGIIASMCVSTYSGRYEVDQLTEKFLQPLLKASEKLEQLL